MILLPIFFSELVLVEFEDAHKWVKKEVVHGILRIPKPRKSGGFKLAHLSVKTEVES